MASTLSEAYGETPLHLHHIIPIDFDSLKEVPPSHSWPPQSAGDHVHTGIFSGSTATTVKLEESRMLIPTVDLDSPNASKMVGHACETLGMFQVTNHGVPRSLLREVEWQAQRFFSLSAREKIKALRSPRGATGYGVARITPFFDKFMWHEGFTMIGSPVEHAREVWPSGYHRFCEVMEEYQNKMKSLSERLLGMILESLNISEQEQRRLGLHGGSAGTAALQLNSYPPCPDAGQAMGLAPHTDTFLLTILHQIDDEDNAHGLQIYCEGGGEQEQEGGRWVSVYPVNGALVVNVGDMLHIMSNAVFPSVVHRVLASNKGRHRLSVAYFYGPPTDFSVGPLREVVENRSRHSAGDGERGGARFRYVTVKEYVQMKAMNLEKALSMIRINT